MNRTAMVLATIALLAFTDLQAQQPTVRAPEPAPGRYLGVASCAGSGCHGSTTPLAATRILQNEFHVWLDSDKHAHAYNVLFDARSARIARNMRLSQPAYESAVCLGCHSTNVAPASVAGTVDREDGVQCEACHGPASGWRDSHVERGWTHEKSVSRGMTDLRVPTIRAGVCVSCHVGNGEKEVDHELIAAGHPLLAFELDNYTASMPPHWTGARESHGARAWAVGQAVKFRQSLANLERHARGPEWPEFSEMSCMNCHHSLRDSTWRQERGWPDRAGLPAWSPQHWTTLRLIITRVAPESLSSLDPVVAGLGRSVARMNDPAAVATLAARASDLTSALPARIEALQWNDADVRAFMRTIASDRRAILTSDVHTAEQTALALQSLASSLTVREPRLLQSEMMRAIDALFEELASRDDYDAGKFAAILARLEATLR